MVLVLLVVLMVLMVLVFCMTRSHGVLHTAPSRAI